MVIIASDLNHLFMRLLFLTVFCFLFLSFSFAQDRPQIYVFLAEECPISIAMASPLRELATNLGEEVELIAVFPNLKSDQITIRAFLGRHDLSQWQPILDPAQEISRRWGAKVTPEAVVVLLDKVVYRGRISDAYSAPGRARHGRINNELLAVCQTILSGGVVDTPWPEAVGCFITFLAPAP